jgi:hypothetical protein
LWHSDSAVHRTRQRAKRWEWADEAGLMGVFLRDGQKEKALGMRSKTKAVRGFTAELTGATHGSVLLLHICP